MNVESVPDKITRQKLRDLVSSLGIDPDHTLRLEATPEFISVEVYALNDQGQPFAVADDGAKVVATHTLVIQVTDYDE